MKYNYESLLTNSRFVKDNIDLLSALLEYKSDSMMENSSNKARALFAIDNSIEILQDMKQSMLKEDQEKFL